MVHIRIRSEVVRSSNGIVFGIDILAMRLPWLRSDMAMSGIVAVKRTD